MEWSGMSREQQPVKMESRQEDGKVTDGRKVLLRFSNFVFFFFFGLGPELRPVIILRFCL
jgi:hypothetical protein